MSYDKQNFIRLLHHDVFIPSHESKKSVFVYSTDALGQTSSVKEIPLLTHTGPALLDSRLFYFLTGMAFLTIIFCLYRNHREQH
ncbi:MAG: hypothetical protein AAGB12_14735 [Pseudomonadota bacterium]